MLDISFSISLAKYSMFTTQKMLTTDLVMVY